MSSARSPITTHVLDLGTGRPGRGIRVFLRRKESRGEGAKTRGGGAAGDAAARGAGKEAWREIGRGVTDADGRVENLLPAAARIEPGTYSLTFDIAPTGPPSSLSRKTSSSRPSLPPFFPEITVTFVVTDTSAHYHIPLLLSPFGYSTYRGS
jgi:5-hydroxyisourate hydrolase